MIPPGVDFEINTEAIRLILSSLTSKYGKNTVLEFGKFPEDPWVILKRRGNRVRWHNRVTGAVDAGWYRLPFKIPPGYYLKGLTEDQFNILSRAANWPGI